MLLGHSVFKANDTNFDKTKKSTLHFPRLSGYGVWIQYIRLHQGRVKT